MENKITFQFISEPGDVNFGGKVHGGAVMKWIDQMIKRITNSDSPLNSQFRIKRHNIVCQSSTIDYVNVY